jgi:hypothetical protein
LGETHISLKIRGVFPSILTKPLDLGLFRAVNRNNSADMNETVKPPAQFVILFGFWATLRREAYFGFFAILFIAQPFKARVAPSSAY